MLDIDNLRLNFEAKVLEADKVVLVPHLIADFDAIGSALGLSVAISKLRKTSLIILDDKDYDLDRGVQAIVRDTKQDFNVVTRSKYLSRFNPSDNDLFVMTDVNKSYLVSTADLMKDPEKVIIIDHHMSDKQTVDSNYKYISPESSSASEIVFKLLQKMRVRIPKNVANYLLAGIYLDTNTLTKNVNSDTFLIASKLMDAGADINSVMGLSKEDAESGRRVRELVGKLEVLAFKYAVFIAGEDEVYNKRELAKVADFGLKYDVDASFAVGKISDEKVGISARSDGNVDLAKVVQQLGKGGGHHFSAAAEVESSNVLEVGKKLELVIGPSCYIKR